jgi:hypothetical protein
MKTSRLLVIPLLALLACTCQKEESNDIEKGTVSVNIGLFVSVSEIQNNLKATPGAEDFLVTIYNSMDELVLVYTKASQMPEEIALEPGQYYITAHSNNNLPAAFENPYYYGKTSLFSITPGGQIAVTVNCELANTMVSIQYSDALKANFTDMNTTVSTSAGSLVYSKNETRSGYFQPLPMNITVQLSLLKSDGTTVNKTLTGIIPDPKAKKKYEVHIEASSIEGSATFKIILDTTTEPVEIITITENNSPASGIFNEGDLLITEIMYDPSILSDSEGEWFEVFNNTNQTVDMNQLVIRKSDKEQHVVNSSVLLPPHQYFVFSRSANSVSCNDYVYGSSISLNNSGGSLAIFNYGNNGTDGTVVCSVNYGGDGFPRATGASIVLSPLLMTKAGVVLGTSWCKSVSPYDAGDLGTPGLPNDACL